MKVSSNKIRVARAQLGTALQLFLLDRDPFSVQSLACGACEILEGIAQTFGKQTLSNHIMKHEPDMDIAKIKRMRNQYWNSFKHYYDQDKTTPRRDDDHIVSFSDVQNDAALFTGWHDYFSVFRKLPLEAQIFQVWWFVLYEDKVDPSYDMGSFHRTFPNLQSLDRARQKRALRRVIRGYRHDRAVLDHPATEAVPLVCRAIPFA